MEAKKKIVNENLGIEEMSKDDRAVATFSICLFCIFQALHAVEKAVEDMVKELENDPMCNYRGFVRELRAVEAAMRGLHAHSVWMMGGKRRQVEIVCNETYEYMTKTLMQMRFSVQNWTARNGGKNPKLMSAVKVPQAVTFWAINEIKLRIMECGMWINPKRRADFEKLKPEGVNNMLMKLIDRLAELVGDNKAAEEGKDINNCQELLNGLKILDNIATDVDLMALHNAFAIQETMGDEALKEAHIESWYRLHPDKDPRIIAEREARERREAEEAEARRLAFDAIEKERKATEEREAAGAESWAAELEAAQGWKLKKRKK